jgi:long-subunit acyl-CoA synthetase (AMP-forming)
MILTELSETEQALLVGNGRKFLSVIVTGNMPTERIVTALEKVNLGLPHYKQVHKFHLSAEAFTVENGLLTANQKMKRSVIEARYRREIDAIYQVDP